MPACCSWQRAQGRSAAFYSLVSWVGVEMPEASQTSLPHLTCPSRRVERKGRKLRFLGSAPRPVRVRSGAMDRTAPCSTQGLKIWKLLLSHVLSLEGATAGRHGVEGHDTGASQLSLRRGSRSSRPYIPLGRQASQLHPWLAIGDEDDEEGCGVFIPERGGNRVFCILQDSSLQRGLLPPRQGA